MARTASVPRELSLTSKAGLLFSAALIVVFAGVERLEAQGTMEGPTVLRTGQGQPLVTASLPFSLVQASPLNRIAIQFGFETDEVFGPGAIFDSLTLTLVDGSGNLVVILGSVDAGGLAVLPPTPGTTPIAEEDVLFESLVPPVLDPNLATQFAYSLTADLPEGFATGISTLHLDLFDNQNGIASQAWFSDLTVVPEPSAAWLMVAGAVSLGIVFRSRFVNPS